jgi:DNA-binding IclR family transcriptional regulator
LFCTNHPSVLSGKYKTELHKNFQISVFTGLTRLKEPPLTVRGKDSYSIQSVDNALDVLEALCDEGDEVRISRLSERLGMNKMSVFRHLATFENRGYVEKEEGSDRYRLGLSAYEIGQKFLSRMGLLRKARPVMNRMVRECDEAAYVAVRRGTDVLFLDLIDTSQQVKIVSLVGRRYPIEIPAAGRVLLAYAPDDGEAEAEKSDPAEPLAKIREQGFCLDRGAMGDGIASVAVPLFGPGAKLQGALCFVGPDFRLPQEKIENELLPRLLEAGHIISSKLGYFGDGLNREKY